MRAKRTVVLLVLFLGFFLISYFQKQRPLSSNQTVNVEPTTVPVPSGAVASPPATPQDSKVEKTSPPEQILKQAYGARLYTYLFDGSFLRGKQIANEEWQQIRERFATPYPDNKKESDKHNSPWKREANARLGLLKALDPVRRMPQSRQKKEMTAFYQGIVFQAREPLVVQRQALKNLIQLQSDLSEKEKFVFMRKVPRHLLAVAGLTDRELLEVTLAP